MYSGAELKANRRITFVYKTFAFQLRRERDTPIKYFKLFTVNWIEKYNEFNSHLIASP